MPVILVRAAFPVKHHVISTTELACVWAVLHSLLNADGVVSATSHGLAIWRVEKGPSECVFVVALYAEVGHYAEGMDRGGGLWR